MKILMVNKFLYPNGGSETYMTELGAHLCSLGHEVEYFGMEHEGNCVGNSAESYTSDMDFHTASAVDKIKMSFKTVYSKEARIKIRAVLESFRPDVVHLNNFNYQLTPSIILEIRKWEKENGGRVRIIYTAHDYQLVCPNHMLKNPNTGEICENCLDGGFLSCTKGRCIHGSALKSVFGSAEAIYWNSRNIYSELDRIICCSRFMNDMLSRRDVFKGKCITLHNFTKKPKLPEGIEKKPYVLYFGRLSQEKGVKTLIESAKALPEIHFVFAGTGELEEEIGTLQNAEYVGFKTGEELHRLIAEASLSVYPSEWYENCPYSVMESISLATPVTASEIGGIPELIDDGITGVLVPPCDSEKLAESIKNLFENSERLLQMSAQCLKKEFISVEKYTEKYFEILEEI